MPVAIAPAPMKAPRLEPPAPPAPPPRGGGRERREQLTVRVTMLGEQQSLEVVASALSSIERAIVGQHIDDVVSIISDAGDLNERQRRSVRRQVRRFTRSELPEVRNGSLIFTVVAVGATIGVCKWVLDKTLGNSFSQAWKESEAGKRMTERLRKLFDTKITFGARREQVIKALEAKRKFGELDVRSLSKEELNALSLTVQARPPRRIPDET